MTLIKLAYNAVTAQLLDPPEKVADTVSDLLSYLVDGAEQSFAFNQGTWDGKSSFYEYKTNSFPAGFAFMVHKELMRLGYKVQIFRKPPIEPLGPENPIVDAFGNDDPRYAHQPEALRRVEKFGRGIIQVATGGGKSKIAKMIMLRYRRPTLFLTTRKVLMYQMKKQIDALGLNTGIVGDGEEKMVKGVNLGMVQTLVKALEEPNLQKEIIAVTKSQHRSKNKDSNISKEKIRELAQARFDEKTKKRNRYLKFLELIEVVIGEEAHEAGGNSYYEILRHCKNAGVRVALTATPFMRDSAEDNMRLMAAFGSVLIRITEEQLIESGVLAKPIFKFVTSQPHKLLFRSSPWARAYQFGYIENGFMHKDIVRDALMAKRYGLPVLTLIQRMDHGEKLFKKFEHVGLRTVFLRGENEQEEREAALAQLERGEIDAIIGSTIVDVGVDVPGIGLVQLAGGGKAEVALRQRIGRGLRAKKNMPNYAFIADYSCANNIALAEHTASRRNIVKSTPGFRENILPANEDFPWHIFAAQRKAA
ncbi:ATP-dependent RNA-DNA and DNA-DNA helicase protein [Rhizobium phage RHph_N1_15]|nr:ATP-dependent RNA-DNA and DNA-DNA helicase protein [Rhizobium phage RHph_N1_15]QIG75086.1 ATP-dependent RNA-DNA and DNA-DNA helicase protein [Rhizobium phage RHph_N2_6]